MKLSAEKEKELPTVIVGLFSLREKAPTKKTSFCQAGFEMSCSGITELFSRTQESKTILPRFKGTFHQTLPSENARKQNFFYQIERE